MTRLFNRHRRDAESGQILVVVAAGMLLFLALVALVVDLGFSFMLRRQEQNAADPGALAAARYIPTANTGAMWDAACFYALKNGFRPTKTIGGRCDSSGNDESFIAMNWPPLRDAGAYAGDKAYVQVTITQPHHSFFAGVVGMPTITVTNAAVAANDTGTAGAASLVALNPTGCSAGRLHGGGGSGGVYIFPANASVPAGSGGFVQVDSDCGTAYGANDNCMDGPSGGLTIAGGTTIQSNTIYVVGACNVNGSSPTIVPPTSFDELASYVGDPLSLLRPPRASDLPAQACPGGGPSGTASNPKTCNINGTQTLTPGTYYGGWAIGTGTTLTLQPGIYIIAGGGISQTGGLLAASGRVMIFGTDSPVCGTGSTATRCQQKLDFTGTAQLDLRGLDKASPCLPFGSTGCPYGGMLFWQDAHASGAGTAKANIELEGSGSLRLEGTIYSAAGEVIITGNGLGTGCAITGPANCAAVQVISDTWDIGGAGILNMPYDPSKFFNPQLRGLVK